MKIDDEYGSMTNNTAIVSPVFAPESVYKNQLQEQRKDAVVIKRVFDLQTPELMATIRDYLGESDIGVEDAVYLTPTAVSGAGGWGQGQTGGAVAKMDAIKNKKETFTETVAMSEWLDFLKKVVELRGIGHTLVQWDEGRIFGFIDHETHVLTQIDLADVRECRREAKVDPVILAEYGALAEALQLDTALEVVDASRNDRTRAWILGSSPYGYQSSMVEDEETDPSIWADQTNTVLVEDVGPDLPKVSRADMESMWFQDDNPNGSFAKEVPAIGTDDRMAPVEDERE